MKKVPKFLKLEIESNHGELTVYIIYCTADTKDLRRNVKSAVDRILEIRMYFDLQWNACHVRKYDVRVRFFSTHRKTFGNQ